MAVRSLNKVMLIGNLTRDPNLRYTPKGTAVCSFGVATNRSWTGNDDEKQEQVEFHNIVAWAKLAEICGQLLHKGDKVYLEGRLQTREWKGEDEQKRRTTEVVASNMILLKSPSGASSSNDGDDEEVPAEPEMEEAPADDDVEEVEDVSDDIPF